MYVCVEGLWPHVACIPLGRQISTDTECAGCRQVEKMFCVNNTYSIAIVVCVLNMKPFFPPLDIQQSEINYASPGSRKRRAPLPMQRP